MTGIDHSDVAQSPEEILGRNPYPSSDARHPVWKAATRTAETELATLQSELLKIRPMSLPDLAAFVIRRTVGLFDIIAKREAQVVWCDMNIHLYDRFLVEYSAACITMAEGQCVMHQLEAAELGIQLAQRVEYWEAAVRLFVSQQPEEIRFRQIGNASEPAQAESEMQCLPSLDTTGSGGQVSVEAVSIPRRHGFPADIERHRRIVAVVEKYVPSWRSSRAWRKTNTLMQIVRDLDQSEIDVPLPWRWGRTPALDGAPVSTWTGAAEVAKTGNKLVADQIRTSLDAVRRFDTASSSR